MSQFEELIREWDDMMCMEFDASSLKVHGISLVQEQRILDLTAQYIRKLEGVQIESDRRGTDFADRLFRSVEIAEHPREEVREICQRFLSSVGMIFRDEIPRDLPRAARISARRFVIDWSNGNFVGRWPELGIEFHLRDSLAYCVEHIAGADDKLGDAIVSQFLSELREGVVQIPRLTLAVKEASSLTFQWEDASVSLEAPTIATATTSASPQEIGSPILAYFQDRIEESRRRLAFTLMNKPAPENPHVKTLQVIDQMELDDNDPIFDRVRKFVEHANCYSGLDQSQLLSALAETSYFEATEAIALSNPTAIEKRSKVVKSVNRIMQMQSPLVTN